MSLICYLVINLENQYNKKQLEILIKIVDKINVNVKNKYSIEEVLAIPNSIDFTLKEDLIINPVNLSCVFANAIENNKMFNNLGIKIETQKQKTKA